MPVRGDSRSAVVQPEPGVSNAERSTRYLHPSRAVRPLEESPAGNGVRGTQLPEPLSPWTRAGPRRSA